MAPGTDPFEAHLTRAEQLFQAGDVVQAGQIWQAILKRVPGHPTARAGLYKVKLYFDARATQDGLAEAQQLAQKLVPVQASPEEIERRLQRGCELYDAGDIQEALTIWEGILAQHPDHALAKGYADGARRALDPKPPSPTDTTPEALETSALPHAHAAHAQEMPFEAEPEAAAAVDSSASHPSPGDEDIERLLREGCTLYDLGQLEEARAKWEGILDHRPDHTLARNYLDGVRRDLGLPALASAVTASTPSEPLAPEAVKDLEQLLREGSQLFDLGMTEEAVDKWEQALALAPGDSRITSYLEMARKELQPRSRPLPPPPAPLPPPPGVEPPPAVPSLLPLQEPPHHETEPALPLQHLDMAEAVLPPATLTETAPPPRKGLDLPEAVGRVALPAWLRSPRNIGMLLGGGALLAVALGLIQGKRKEIQLRTAVANARASAMAPVARSVQIPDLNFSSEAMLREFDSCLGEDPLRAYFLAQELAHRTPTDPGSTQLLERARTAMATLGGTAVSPKELDRLAQAGDLDGLEQALRSALRQDPDNRELRLRYGRICLQLAQIYAAKEKWEESADALKRGRAMFPQDKSWRARLLLLDNIKGQSKAERESWLHLLG